MSLLVPRHVLGDGLVLAAGHAGGVPKFRARSECRSIRVLESRGDFRKGADALVLVSAAPDQAQR